MHRARVYAEAEGRRNRLRDRAARAAVASAREATHGPAASVAAPKDVLVSGADKCDTVQKVS